MELPRPSPAAEIFNLEETLLNGEKSRYILMLYSRVRARRLAWKEVRGPWHQIVMFGAVPHPITA
jgi:hypothetical protein